MSPEALNRDVEQRLQLCNRFPEFLNAAEVLDDIHHVSVFGNRRNFENVRDNELHRTVVGILLQQFVEDLSCLGTVLLEEVLAFGADPLGPFTSGS